MKEEYCPNNEIQRLFPHLVAPENKMIEQYIYGLASQIRRMVVATEPRIIQNAISKVGVLTDEAVRNGSLKRRWQRIEARPKTVTSLNAKNPTTARGVCYECGGTDHYKSACPRLNRALGKRGNHLNQAMAIEGGQGPGNNKNPTCGRAFVMGAEEAR
nr:hypothetical protein [Tanacetum cinerariifolium]